MPFLPGCFVFCCLLVMQWSCHSGKQLVSYPAEASLIDGTWQRDCLPLDETEQSQKIIMTFQFASQFERVERIYSDRNCQDPMYELRYQGRYELTVAWEAFEYIIDFWVARQELKSLSATWIAIANAEILCGKSDWEIPLLGIGQGFTRDPCPLQFLLVDYHQNLIEVNQTKLIFAALFQPGRVLEPMIDGGRKELQFVRINI